MNAINCYRLDALSVVDIVGVDAAKIIHNLTTNEVTRLAAGSGCESFITDVRGKTLGHVLVFGTDVGLRLIGAGGQSTKLVEHIDRYTIREDAEPRVRDDDYVAIVLTPDAARKAEIGTPSKVEIGTPSDQSLVSGEIALGDDSATAYLAPWLGRGSVVVLTGAQRSQSLIDWCDNNSFVLQDEASFQRQRTLCGFPWYGTDLDESNLPQEADRNEQAISFTKGCYLGQETVARLDALGQVQKKLVRWSLRGAIPPGGTALTAADKTVGRLTSIATGGDESAIAIGMARRSHFDAGSVAEGIDPVTQQPFEARVM